MILKSNYDEIDFDALYKAQRRVCSFAPKTKEDWDKKAIKFYEGALNSGYADDFLARVDFSDADSVLDFACGAGALSLKAANLVNSVTACDFSPKMLEYLAMHTQNLGLKNIKIIQKSFEDSWDDLDAHDLVFASRCLEVDEPKMCLEKLLSKTKKRLYFTFKAESSFVDEQILRVLGREVAPKPNYIYIVNIIAQMGYLPNLSFIDASSSFAIASEDELIERVTWELGSKLSDDECQKLRTHYKNGNKHYTKSAKWAFVCVKKN